jgi:hypothetical protein
MAFVSAKEQKKNLKRKFGMLLNGKEVVLIPSGFPTS